MAAARKLNDSPTSSQLCSMLVMNGQFDDSLDFFWENQYVEALNEHEEICRILETSFTSGFLLFYAK